MPYTFLDIPYISGRQPFLNAAQITLSIAIEDPLYLKPRLQNDYATRLQNKKTVRCFKSRASAKRAFVLARSHRWNRRNKASIA